MQHTLTQLAIWQHTAVALGSISDAVLAVAGGNMTACAAHAVGAGGSPVPSKTV